jgi:hypothetical protein
MSRATTIRASEITWVLIYSILVGLLMLSWAHVPG